MTDAEKQKMKKLTKSTWKEQHNALIEQLKYNKQMKIVEERGGNVRDMPPPPKADYSHLKECPYCGRKFNQEAHEKHVKICKNVVNKPKAPPAQTMSKTSVAKPQYDMPKKVDLKQNEPAKYAMTAQVKVNTSSKQDSYGKPTGGIQKPIGRK